MSYVSEQLELLKRKNASEPEFLQAATEVLTSLEPVINAEPKYQETGILERSTEPERQTILRVPWVDATGKLGTGEPGLPGPVQLRHRAL